MRRPSLSRAVALALLAALVAAATAAAATVRTDATPATLRSDHDAYMKLISARYRSATRLLDAQLAKHPKKPTVVLDIDETTLSNWSCLDAADFELTGLVTCLAGGTSVAFPAARTFIAHARARKVEIAFITGAPQVICAGRRKNLIAQGIKPPFSLACRPADDHHDSLVPYKSGARKALVAKGATIVLNIGDQKSDLAGGAARRTLKLPNPIYVTA
jgi:predicted secreted acid phosphatase